MKKSFALLMIAILLLSMGAGATYAKYVTQHTQGGTITLKAELGSIELWEHEAERQADGSYVLDQDREVAQNTYILLPGLDIPKDPFVRIVGKSSIEAYVFVEVVDELGDNSGIHYSLTDDWTEVTGVTGAHGGAVYVYKTPITNTFGEKGNGTIQILNGNTVEIHQTLDKSIKNLKLTFYASMYEVASGDDAAKVYENNTKTNP